VLAQAIVLNRFFGGEFAQGDEHLPNHLQKLAAELLRIAL